MTTACAYNYDAVKTAVNPAFSAKPMPMTHPPCLSFPTTTTYAAFSVCVWLSKDPIGEEGGYNFYLVFNNNPISGYDAFGLIVLKAFYGESTSIEELKELRSWLMSLPALPSLGDYQQALVNLQFWFNVDASRPGELEISEEWLKRQPAVVQSLARLVQHFCRRAR